MKVVQKEEADEIYDNWTISAKFKMEKSCEPIYEGLLGLNTIDQDNWNFESEREKSTDPYVGPKYLQCPRAKGTHQKLCLSFKNMATLKSVVADENNAQCQ